jgi:hypothetical protein
MVFTTCIEDAAKDADEAMEGRTKENRKSKKKTEIFLQKLETKSLIEAGFGSGEP